MLRVPKTVLLSVIAVGVFTRPAAPWDETPMPFDTTSEALHVVGTASDEDAFRQFYHEAIGLPELEPLDLPEGPMLRFQAGRSELQFIIPATPLKTNPGGPKSGRGIRMLTIFCNDPAGVVARLKKIGADVSRIVDNDAAPLRGGYVNDPDGNELNLVFLPDGVEMDSYRRMMIGLTVANPTASRKFYGSTLGLHALEPASPGGDRLLFQFQAGPTTLKFVHDDPALPAYTGAHSAAYGLWYLQIRVADLDEIAEDLKEKDVTILEEPHTVEGVARVMSIGDPDGIVVQFVSAL